MRKEKKTLSRTGKRLGSTTVYLLITQHWPHCNLSQLVRAQSPSGVKVHSVVFTQP